MAAYTSDQSDYAEWERRQAAYAFRRSELRHSSCVRELYPGCGCTIGAREPYMYSVAKVASVEQLIQSYECDEHMRRGHRY